MVTSLNIHPASEFVVGLYARKHLGEMYWVGITQYFRHVLQLLQVPDNGTVSPLLDRRSVAMPSYGNAVKRYTPRSALILSADAHGYDVECK